MNKKAEELGLKNTHFVTPHGLDETEHYTSAHELALITNHALNNKKFASMVGTKTCNISINGVSRTISNTNELLGYLNGVDGVKTGFTNNAGRCLVTSTTRNGHQIICVVLGADTKKIRTQDSVKLIEYAFSHYEYVNVKNKIEEEFEDWKKKEAKDIKYNKAVQDKTEYILGEIELKEIPVLKNKVKDIQIEVTYEKEIHAPIKKDQSIGKIEMILDEEVLFSTDIQVKDQINKKNIWDYLKQLCTHYTSYINEEIGTNI